MLTHGANVSERPSSRSYIFNYYKQIWKSERVHVVPLEWCSTPSWRGWICLHDPFLSGVNHLEVLVELITDTEAQNMNGQPLPGAHTAQAGHLDWETHACGWRRPLRLVATFCIYNLPMEVWIQRHLLSRYISGSTMETVSLPIIHFNDGDSILIAVDSSNNHYQLVYNITRPKEGKLKNKKDEILPDTDNMFGK